MKITEDIRQFAREQGLDDASAVDAGMEQMAENFREKGGRLYVEAGD
jgi:phosphomethylpyrimidine synthase